MWVAFVHKYSSTQSSPRPQREVSLQVHAPTAVPPTPLEERAHGKHLTGGSKFRGQGDPLFLPLVVNDLELGS
jgi:hypothetical protein